MGVRYGAANATTAPHVHYARLTGDREAKLAQLDRLQRLSDLTWQSSGGDVSATSSDGHDDQRENQWSAPFSPRASPAYARWPLLTELFPWQLSGAQLKRTWPIGPTPDMLRARWDCLLALAGPERAAAFHETRDRSLDSTPADLHDPKGRLEALRALGPGTPSLAPVRYAYRSFDRQWVLPDARLGDFMRPALWRIAGPRQIFLTSMLTNVMGPGPAAVATALVPDLDHFRGSFGARAVIPLWRDAQGTVPNVAGEWLARLSERFGTAVDAETLMAYCYAVLGTRSYMRRFDEEVRTPGPRIPFPRGAAVFQHAADLGRRLLWLHTFGERCGPSASLEGMACCIEQLRQDYPTAWAYEPTSRMLRVGDGAFGPLSAEVWAYSVSGMRIVSAWLRRRLSKPGRGRSALDAIGRNQWTDALTRELLEVIWVLEATLALEPELDAVLDEIVSGGGAFAGVRHHKQRLDVERLERPREDEALTLVTAELLEQRPL